MSSIQVVSVSNRVPKEPYYFFEKFRSSLDRFGVTPTVLGFGEPWYGLMTKPRHLRKWLRERRNHAEYLLFCDAWDVIFVEHPDQIFARYQARDGFNDAVVSNAERNCFPRAELAPLFPDPGTPWRYVNAGVMIGKAEAFLAILESMKLDCIPNDTGLGNGNWFNPNDQEYYTFEYLKQPTKIVLDTRCELFQACHGSQESELELIEGGVKNLITGTQPGILHFNGNSKNNLLPKILTHLKL